VNPSATHLAIAPAISVVEATPPSYMVCPAKVTGGKRIGIAAEAITAFIISSFFKVSLNLIISPDDTSTAPIFSHLCLSSL